MNWKRALLGGLLAEILVLVLISPVAFAVGLDKLGDPANVPTLSQWGLLLTILLVGALAAVSLRRRALRKH